MERIDTEYKATTNGDMANYVGSVKPTKNITGIDYIEFNPAEFERNWCHPIESIEDINKRNEGCF